MKGRKTGGWLIAPGLWSVVIVLIFVFSSQSYQEQSIQPLLRRTLSVEQVKRVLPDVHFRYNGKAYSREVNPYGLIEFLFRKGAHLFMYGLLGAATAFTVKSRWKRAGAPFVVLLSLTAVLAVAVLDEWNQSRSVDRTPAREDVLVDLAGGFLGLAVFYALRRLGRLVSRNGMPS